MKAIINILITVLLISTSLYAQYPDEDRAIQLSVIADQPVFVTGENINFTLVVENTGANPVTFHFGTVCWFDYWIDYNYQYLNGTFCITLPYTFDLQPGESFQESFTHTPSQYTLSPGQHLITGIVNGSPSTTGSTLINVVAPEIQTIDLSTGWNLISLDIIPDPPSPASVFSPSNLTSTLEIVTGFQNQQGVFYDPNGLPILNTLTQIVPGEGYWVKVSGAGTLTVEGAPVPENEQIDLVSGWNLIGYWLPDPQAPEQAFAPLVSTGVLEVVTGYENGGLFFDPDGLPVLNTLTEVKNGFGYWVKLNANYPGFAYE